ncbi:MAG: hypothetical protein HKL80_02970, partial [Acidimicrobiales bacterium]|nr:hypothetical protein [Acidimicrobiales bacterium]
MSPRSRGRWDRGGDNEFEDQEGSADNHEYDDAEPGASSMDSIEEATGAGQVMGLLGEAISTVSAARTMPLSSSVLVVKEELLEILESARQVLPDELRSARWLLKEREEYLARAEREAASILEEA